MPKMRYREGGQGCCLLSVFSRMPSVGLLRVFVLRIIIIFGALHSLLHHTCFNRV